MDNTSFEFLQQRATLLYTYDDNNRLLSINESDSQQPIPYFYLMRTATHTLCRIRHDIPDELADKLEKLAQTEPPTADLQNPLHVDTYRKLLEQHVSISQSYLGPAYTLPELTPTQKTTLITSENKALLQANFAYAIHYFDELNPIVVYALNGEAVAICFCSRRTQTLAEAGVYTVEKYRGNGYATLVVRDWSISVRATNRQPLYSTSDDNLASQSVAKKLGAVHYGTDFSFA